MKKHPFLRDAHSCSYCQRVNGVTFDRPGPDRGARLLWVRCPRCTERTGQPKAHYICRACLVSVGWTANGEIAVCARVHWKRLRAERREAELRAKGGVAS